MKHPFRPALGLVVALPLLAACSGAPPPGTVVAAAQRDPAAHAPADPAPAARAKLQVAGVAESPDAQGVLMLPLRNPHGDGTKEIAVVGPLLDLEVARARASTDQVGYPAVAFSLAPASRKALHEFSARHVDRQVAIVVDGLVVSVPIVNEPLAGDSQISGRFTPEEVADLVQRLQPAR